MQATLSPRSLPTRTKLLDAVSSKASGIASIGRSPVELGRSNSISSAHPHEGFASKLSAAQERSSRAKDRVEHDGGTRPADETQPAKATDRSSKPAEADDSSEATDEHAAPDAGAAKSKRGAKDDNQQAEEQGDAQSPDATGKPSLKPIEASQPTEVLDTDAKPVATDADGKHASDKNDDSVDAAELAGATMLAAQSATSDDTTADGEATDLLDAVRADPATTPSVVQPDAKAAKAQPDVKADSKAAGTENARIELPPEAKSAHQESSDKKGDDATEDPSAGVKLPQAATPEKHKASAESTFDELLAKLAPQDAAAPKPQVDRPAQSTTPHLPPEQKFAADNVDNVVKSVHTQVSTGGGEMRMRLDPPELGALDVAVKMVDGKMTASFTTSNEQATQLLSHSLNNLRQSLEASGITVDRIQVRQSSTDNNAQQQPGEHRQNGESSAFDQPSHRGDQQRKEDVQKMWRKIAYGSDELDFVA